MKNMFICTCMLTCLHICATSYMYIYMYIAQHTVIFSIMTGGCPYVPHPLCYLCSPCCTFSPPLPSCHGRAIEGGGLGVPH